MVTSFVLGLIAFGVAFLFYLWKSQQRPANTPPGPWRKPLLGNLTDFGDNPPVSLHQIAKNYPEGVFSLQLGRHFTIILADREAIIACLQRAGPKSANRLHTRAFDVITNEGRDLALGDYSSPHWKVFRKLIHASTFSLSHSDFWHERVNVQLQRWFPTVDAVVSDTHSASIDPQLKNLSLSVIWNGVFNDDFDFSAPGLQSLVDDVNYLFWGTVQPDVFDFLGGFFQNFTPSWWKEYTSASVRVFAHIKKVVAERQRIFKAKGPNATPECTCDRMIQLLTTEEYERSGITIDHVEAAIFNLWAAGQDTTSTSINWLVLYLARYPEWQEKIYEELASVTNNFTITLSYKEDREKTPILNAVMKEVSRLTVVGPMYLPHRVLRTFEYKGYTFPEGTGIMANAWGAMRDERTYPEPEKFDPTRFLGPEEKQQPAPIPFSVGPRECVGKNLAYIELYLIATQLLSRYRFEEDPKNPISFVAVYGLTYQPQKGQGARVIRRVHA